MNPWARGILVVGACLVAGVKYVNNLHRRIGQSADRARREARTPDEQARITRLVEPFHGPIVLLAVLPPVMLVVELAWQEIRHDLQAEVWRS